MRRTRRIPKILSEDDLKRIIFAIDNSLLYHKNGVGEYMKWRDVTMFMLMYYCGLRPKECICLRWEDVDIKKREIRINPLNNKERNNMPALMSMKSINLLITYKEKINMLGISNAWIFPSVLTMLPLTTDYLGKRFQRIVAEAGLQKVDYYTEDGRPFYNYNMYSLRHSFCTKIYSKTKSEKSVSALARHLSPESAHIYIHLDKEDKQKIIDDVFG